MKIFISKLGAQYFLVFEDHYALPINKITDIDLHFKDKMSVNNVCIRIGDIQYLFTYEQADSIREFLLQNQVVSGQNLLPKEAEQQPCRDYRLDKF